METKDKPVIPPVYDRPGNLQRKMAMMARHIADIKNMLDYYGWVFAGDPWFVQRLQEAENIYAELEAAFKESMKGLMPADEDYDEKIRAAGQYIIQKHMGTLKELAKGPEG